MQTQEKRDQKGVWKKAAPCLYQYQTNKVYYAVVRRAGKLIRKSLEVTQLEVAKRKLRDYLNDLENSAPDAHKVRLDDYMKEFLKGRTGKPKTLKRYAKMVSDVEKTWPGGSREYLRKVDLDQCKQWLAQWNGKVAQYNHGRQWLLAFFDFAVANKKLQRSPHGEQEACEGCSSPQGHPQCSNTGRIRLNHQGGSMPAVYRPR